MNISGLVPDSGFYDYNSVKLNEVRGRQIALAMSKAPKPVEEEVEEKEVVFSIVETSKPLDDELIFGRLMDKKFYQDDGVLDLSPDSILEPYLIFSGEQAVSFDTDQEIDMVANRRGIKFIL